MMALHVDMRCDLEASLIDRPELLQTRCVNRGLKDAEPGHPEFRLLSWGRHGWHKAETPFLAFVSPHLLGFLVVEGAGVARPTLLSSRKTTFVLLYPLDGNVL
jgi:hypothetical protein